MHTKQINSGKSNKGISPFILRLLPFGLLIFIYALLVTRPVFIVAGYSSDTAPMINNNGNSSVVSDHNLIILEPDDLDLAILKNHSGDFEIGQSGEYTINVINVGSESIESPITVTDNLPIGLTPTSVIAQGWEPCDISEQLLTCVYSNTTGLSPSINLPPLSLSVVVDERAAPEVTNFAVVSNDDDSNADNNITTDTTTIISADLEVSKSVSPTVVAEGDTVDYTISILNNGPSTTSGVVLTDTLPSGVTFNSAITSKGNYDSTTGFWTVGNLANGEVVTLTIAASVDLGTKGFTILNSTDGIKSNLYDYDESNNTDSTSFRLS
jgi:uncharacterized repeat protein (TIGR01451 family)